jgi:hypothetical protein
MFLVICITGEILYVSYFVFMLAVGDGFVFAVGAGFVFMPVVGFVDLGFGFSGLTSFVLSNFAFSCGLACAKSFGFLSLLLISRDSVRLMQSFFADAFAVTSKIERIHAIRPS